MPGKTEAHTMNILTTEINGKGQLTAILAANKKTWTKNLEEKESEQNPRHYFFLKKHHK